MLISSEGIVLKQRKIAGGRRMIVLFTKRYGKISAGTGMNERGKGKSALALRPFTYAEYEIFKNRGFYNINGGDVKKSFYSIGEKLDRFMTASRIIEYIDDVSEEEQPMPYLFNLTLEALEVISTANRGFDTIFCAYIVKSLRMLGVMPELSHCANCGRIPEKNKYSFSVEAGGVLCDDCLKNIHAQADERHSENSGGGEHEGNAGRRPERVPDKRPDTLIFRPDFDIIDTLNFLLEKPLKEFTRVSLRPEYIEELKGILKQYTAYYLDTEIYKDELDIKL